MKIPSEDKEIFDYLDIARYGNKVHIAGGAALSWYNKTPLSGKDIDIWCSDKYYYDQVLHRLSNCGNLIFESDNANTYDVRATGHFFSLPSFKKKYRVQLIKQIDSIHNIINNFDINVCKIATDGVNWIYGDGFFEDFENKSITIGKLNSSTVKRCLKYVIYGYSIKDDDIGKIIHHYDKDINSLKIDLVSDDTYDLSK